MLTLHPHPDNVKICDMREGKNIQPVYYHPKIDPTLRNSVADVGAFFTEDFRDRYELSSAQADDIKDHLRKGSVCEKHQHKHFQCKRSILDSLNEEMDVRGTEVTFEINFEGPGDSWPNNNLICGATSSGKTYFAKERVLRNLKGPKKNRHRVIWFSSEWNEDATLKELKKEKYREWVIGVDISDSGLANSIHPTPQEFFKHEILALTESAPPGTIICYDDPIDAGEGLQTLLRNLINRSLRIARHSRTGIMYIIHRIKSGQWSTQGTSSCKYFTLFPRTKHKVIQFLNQEMGLPLKEARRHTRDFSASGRTMTIRLFSPQMLIGEKIIRQI